MGLCHWLCCRPSPEFEDFKFSPIDTSFIYVLESPVLVFINVDWRGFSTIAPNIIIGSLWTLAPLMVCAGELYEGDDGVL